MAARSTITFLKSSSAALNLLTTTNFHLHLRPTAFAALLPSTDSTSSTFINQLAGTPRFSPDVKQLTLLHDQPLLVWMKRSGSAGEDEQKAPAPSDGKTTSCGGGGNGQNDEEAPSDGKTTSSGGGGNHQNDEWACLLLLALSMMNNFTFGYNGSLVLLWVFILLGMSKR